MVDLANEQPVPLAHIARRVPNSKGGRGVNVATIWRWCSRGVKGVRLETVQVGGIRMTSDEALTRFFERLTAAANGTAPQPTPARRKRAISQAAATLTEAGI